jgi:two-component system phosphate regulon response regulator PhoB
MSSSDADKAIQVWQRDEEVDEMYSLVFRELLTYMMEDPRNISALHPPAVHRQEHRAHRRSRHQHRRDRALPGAWPADRRDPPEGRQHQLHAGRGPRRDAGGARRMSPLILIVEDEAALVTLLRYNLEREGFRVVSAPDGEEALLLAREEKPDLILLDWMLPLLSGIEVCRQLRRLPETRAVPIIMLTARGEEGDKLRGLDSGADDYVTKPFSPSELVARIRAVMRRTRPAANGEVLHYDDLVMDLASHRVRRKGRDIHLGPTEFRLLRHLMEHQGRVFSREQLLDIVWGQDVYVEPRTVDVHIRRLRKAINADEEADLIRTVRSAGYALDRSA